MSQRTARTFFAMVVAILLVFMGDGLIILYANLSSFSKQIDYPISFQNASHIAAEHAPGATVVGTPTLINYAGTMAYEVTLDKGMIYVEANTGRVLGDTTRGPISCEQNGGG
jgi:hypothetical protein